jgi:hypothetical protein
MEKLAAFRPHLTGAVWRGTATRLNSIFIDLFCDDSKSAEIALIDQRIDYDVSSVDGPRGRVLDVLNLHVPSAKIPAASMSPSPCATTTTCAAPSIATRAGAATAAIWPRCDRARRGREPAPRRSRRRRPRRGGDRRGHCVAARSPRRRGRRAPEVSIDSGGSNFKGVEGAPIKMASWRGRPLLLNFWATWCGPCVVEMPLLDRFAREQRPGGWQVLALAVDQPDPGTALHRRADVDAPGGDRRRRRLDLSAPPRQCSGGLPFTAAFDSSGPPVQRRLGSSAPSCWPAGRLDPLGISPDLPLFGGKVRHSPRICRFCGQGAIDARPRPDASMDLRKLKTLIDLVSESNISELEIAEADGKVRIVKASAQAAPAAAPAAPPAPVTSRAGRTGRARGSRHAGADRQRRQVADGRTFYRSASPGSDPSSRSAASSRSATRSASSRR